MNIWTGEAHHGGEITVDAPIGKPPVFYRAKSEWASLLLLYGISIRLARRETCGQMEKNNESNIIESGNPTLAV